MLDDVQEVGGRLIVRGYRKIAAQHGCAPTVKTTDGKIIEIHANVGAAFNKAAERRGEHISALVQNYIVLKFFQVYEMLGEQRLQGHLQYEVDIRADVKGGVEILRHGTDVRRGDIVRILPAG